MAPIVAGIAAFLSLTAFVFYIVGTVGNSNSKGVIKNVNWIYYNHNGIKSWFGLQKVFFEYEIGDQTVDYKLNYHDCKDNDDDSVNSCKSCDRNGKAAIGLVATSVCLSFFVIIANVYGLVSEEPIAKIAGIVLSFITFLFSVIAVGLFMNYCYNEINNEDYVNGKYLYYGPGAALVTLGYLLMIIVCILDIINLAMGGGNSYTPPPKSTTESEYNNTEAVEANVGEENQN